VPERTKNPGNRTPRSCGSDEADAFLRNRMVGLAESVGLSADRNERKEPWNHDTYVPDDSMALVWPVD
jgi:hypothetical protein